MADGENIDCRKTPNSTDGLCTENGINNGPVEIKKRDGTVEVKRKRNLEGKILGLFEKDLLKNMPIFCMSIGLWEMAQGLEVILMFV